MTVFEKNEVNSKVATIVLRGPTNAMMDEIERALQSGVSAFKQFLSSVEYVNGGSAIECYLLNKLDAHA